MGKQQFSCVYYDKKNNNNNRAKMVRNLKRRWLKVVREVRVLPRTKVTRVTTTATAVGYDAGRLSSNNHCLAYCDDDEDEVRLFVDYRRRRLGSLKNKLLFYYYIIRNACRQCVRTMRVQLIIVCLICLNYYYSLNIRRRYFILIIQFNLRSAAAFRRATVYWNHLIKP